MQNECCYCLIKCAQTCKFADLRYWKLIYFAVLAIVFVECCIGSPIDGETATPLFKSERPSAAALLRVAEIGL